MISSRLIKLASVAFASVLLAGTSGTAFAESQWDQNHPWRDQVNDRLHNQHRRIGQERREGELGRGQVRQLRRDDHRIRQEERRMASRDGGHLTRADHRILNHQENRISHRIGR